MAGDLNLKKSWNPQLVKNQRKVYEEEQAKLQEYKKIKQKNEEISKQQEYLNLLKLQYGEDFNPANLSKNEKLKLSKTNWMYTDYQPTSEVNSSGFNEVNQEFLEGKKKVESLLLGSKSLVSNTNNSKINQILNAGKNSVVKSSLDDPLALINKQKMKIIEKPGSDRHRTEDKHRIHKSKSQRHTKRDESKNHRHHRQDSKTHRGSRSHREHPESYRDSKSH